MGGCTMNTWLKGFAGSILILLTIAALLAYAGAFEWDAYNRKAHAISKPIHLNFDPIEIHRSPENAFMHRGPFMGSSPDENLESGDDSWYQPYIEIIRFGDTVDVVRGYFGELYLRRQNQRLIIHLKHNLDTEEGFSELDHPHLSSESGTLMKRMCNDCHSRLLQ